MVIHVNYCLSQMEVIHAPTLSQVKDKHLTNLTSIVPLLVESQTRMQEKKLVLTAGNVLGKNNYLFQKCLMEPYSPWQN